MSQLRYGVAHAAVGAAVLVVSLTVLSPPSPVLAAPSDVTGPWGEARTIVSGHRGAFRETPALVRTRAGRHVAVWLRRGVDGFVEPVTAVRSVGGPWGRPAFVGGPGGAYEVVADVNGQDRVTVAWRAPGNRPGAVQVWTRTLRPGGDWAPAERIAVYHDSGGVRSGLVFAARGAAMFVAWQGPETIGSRYRDESGQWQPVQQLPGSTGFSSRPGAAVTPDGQAHLVAVHEVDTQMVLEDFVRAADGVWTMDRVGTVNSGNSFFSGVADVDANNNGDLAVAWTRDLTDQTTQPVVRVRHPGGDFGPIHELAAAGRFPAVEITAHGVVVAAWEEAVRNEAVRLLLARRRLDQTWTPPERVAHLPGDPEFTRVLGSMASNRRGAAVLVVSDKEEHYAVARCRRSTPCERPAFRPEFGQDFRPNAVITPGGGALVLSRTDCGGENCTRTDLRTIRLLHG